MKILLIMQDFLPDLPGGIANYVYRICADLAPEVEPLVPAYGAYQNFDRQQAFTVHRRAIPIEPPAFMRASRWHWLRLPYIFYIALAQWVLFTWHGGWLVRQRQAQIILMGHLYLAPIGCFLGWLLHKPYGVMLHGGELHRYWHWPWVKAPLLFALNRATFLTVNTDFTRRHYLARGVRSDQRFVHIYPGVDTQHFYPRLANSGLRTRYGLNGHPTLVTVARLVDWKGHETVLRALPTVLQTIPDVHYLIAGQGPYQAELVKLVKMLHLEAHATFVGFVADEQLPDLYNSADLFVQPSRETANGTMLEGFGIVFIEASACGLPVIGGRTGGTGEAIAEGVSGLLVDPHDVAALAAAMIRLLQDRAYARQLGQQGRQRAVAEFDWSIQTARLRAFLQEVAGVA